MYMNNLLKVFTPKYYSMFPFFEKNAGNLVAAAEQLKLLMQTSDPEKQAEITKHISELEKNGEKITNDTCAFLSTLFIVPFDREDISELANKINDVLDYISSTGRMVKLYKLNEKYSVYIEMAEIIYLASKKISNCFEHLKDINSYKGLIIKGCENIRNLEKRADEIFYTGILNLFIEKENVIRLTKKKDILDRLMKCIHKTNAVVEVLRNIQLKVS
jgi:uncharacterized protein